MILLDTNILARSAQPAHSQHQTAVDAVAVLRLQGEILCLVPQVLYGYWSVATRPVAQNGLGMTAADASADIAASVGRFQFFHDERAIFERWQQLVVQCQSLGKNGHDARLVAAMKRHGIVQILTFNMPDFHRYPGIQVLDPRQVAKGAVP